MSSSFTTTSRLFALLAPFGQDLLQLFLGLLFRVAQGGGFFEILRLDRRFLFARECSSISSSMSFTSGGRVIAPMRARAPASSITSIALSGRKRPVR